jgi:hypothetical protein
MKKIAWTFLRCLLELVSHKGSGEQGAVDV